VVKANMLQPLRSAIYAFKADFVVAAWIARLKPTELEAAQAELRRAGFPNPAIRDFDDQPLDLKALDKPINVLMDLEPRNPKQRPAPAVPSTAIRLSARCWRGRWRRASRWPPTRSRCSARTGRWASCWRHRCSRRALRIPRASSLSLMNWRR